MGGDEGVHEGLEVGSPPLSQAIADLPVTSFLALAESTHRGQALVQACFEAIKLVLFGLQVIAREFEEGIGDLQHQDVRVVVLMAHQDALARAAHSMGGEVLFQTLQAGQNGRVLLGLGFFDTEGVVGQRVQADGSGLVRVELQGQDRRLCRLQRRGSDCRHVAGWRRMTADGDGRRSAVGDSGQGRCWRFRRQVVGDGLEDCDCALDVLMAGSRRPTGLSGTASWPGPCFLQVQVDVNAKAIRLAADIALCGPGQPHKRYPGLVLICIASSQASDDIRLTGLFPFGYTWMDYLPTRRDADSTCTLHARSFPT